MELRDPSKTYVINPRVEVTIFDTQKIVIWEQYIDFDIRKDIDEEPNEASLVIYNLNESTRKQILEAGNNSAPIEIRLTPSGSEELVLAFKGEVDHVKNHNLTVAMDYDPGHATEIYCTSQKLQHRSIYIDRTYSVGTPVASIITDLISEMNLPVQMAAPPTDVLLLSQTFHGPAFAVLKKFVRDFGFYAFIHDGTLVITAHNVAVNPVPYVFSDPKAILLSAPEETEVSDAEDVEIKTVLQINQWGRAKKKKTKTHQVVDSTDYVSFESVDITVKGMDFKMLCQPARQPDEVIMFPLLTDIAESMFRIREVSHYGNNYGGDWTTELRTVVYDT